jgi:hypothetical protein
MKSAGKSKMMTVLEIDDIILHYEADEEL